MAVTEYGTIGIRPMGAYDPDTKYGLLNLVEYDGSSYVAHTDPPLGSLPTNTSYWQVSAQGTGKATADSVGTVKPDGTTTEVSTDGSISVKTATQEALGLVKGSNGIKVGSDGGVDVNTLFTQATELANIIAGEAIATALGKISKSIAVTMGLNENAVLKSMISNMDVNDSTKLNSAAYVHKLTERIGMGEELATGANLTAAFNALNSNLAERLFFGSGTALQVKNGSTWRRMQVNPDGAARIFKSEDSGATWSNNEKILTNSDVGFEGIVKFTCGFDPSTNVLYLRGYINATDFYQLNCEPTRLLFGKQINGQWYGMWNK